MSEAEIQIVFANGNRLPRNVQTAIHWEGNSSLPWEMSELQRDSALLERCCSLCVFCRVLVGAGIVTAVLRGGSSEQSPDADSW